MGSSQNLFSEMAARLEKGDAAGVKELTQKALDQGAKAEEILNKGLVTGMDVIGEKFKNNEVFIPEVLIAARAMKAGMEIIKPLLAEAKVKAKGKIIVGTVKGDLHDIGKNIVAMMLEGAGFDIVDMGTDVAAEKILQHVIQDKPDVVGLSALLTTTMVYMKEIVDTLEKNGVRKKVKVIIGGAPITNRYAEEIKADGYAPDAASAVDLVKSLLNITR